jgi:uncharacterized membrane protein
MRQTLSLALAAALFSLIPCSAEAAYYADVAIDVSESGMVTISGITNHPALSESPTSAYTSKSGQYWILNITTYDIFSDYVYSIRMPEGSVINYIRSDDRIGIREDGSRIIIDGYGKEEAFSVLIQYSINPPDYTAYALLAAAAALVALSVMLARRRLRLTRGRARPYDPSSLTERQLAIVRFLEKSGGKVGQSEVEKALSLPKSSLSRNVRTLERMGVLRKTSRGMGNVLQLSEG